MQERGRVQSVDNKAKKVTVQFDRKSACDKCGMCLMSKDSMKVELVLDNELNACEGDIVDVSMGSGYVLTSSFVVYLIPIMLIVVGLLITRNLSELIQVIAITSALVISFTAIRIADKIIRNRKGFKPRIINIQEKSKEEKEDVKY